MRGKEDSWDVLSMHSLTLSWRDETFGWSSLCDLFEYGCVYILVNEALIWSSYCLFTFTVILASYSWTPRQRADNMLSHGRVKTESICCVQLEQWPGSGEARRRTAAFIWGGVTDWRADQWAWQGWTRTTTGRFWTIIEHKQKFSFTINMTNRETFWLVSWVVWILRWYNVKKDMIYSPGRTMAQWCKQVDRIV